MAINYFRKPNAKRDAKRAAVRKAWETELWIRQNLLAKGMKREEVIPYLDALIEYLGQPNPNGD